VRALKAPHRNFQGNTTDSLQTMILRSNNVVALITASALLLVVASVHFPGSASAFMVVAGHPPRRSPLSFSYSSNSRLSAAAAAAFEGTAVVCTGPTCSANGSKKALQIFEELAAQCDGRLNIETINCVSECAECAMGPNVELRAKGDEGPFYPIKNKVKTEEDVKTILGLSDE
jgi:hypothetical protein